MCKVLEKRALDILPEALLVKAVIARVEHVLLLRSAAHACGFLLHHSLHHRAVCAVYATVLAICMTSRCAQRFRACSAQLVAHAEHTCRETVLSQIGHALERIRAVLFPPTRFTTAHGALL